MYVCMCLCVGVRDLQHVIQGHILNFGVKLPEDDINDAEIYRSNIRIY
jgi:hypothetical protein